MLLGDARPDQPVFALGRRVGPSVLLLSCPLDPQGWQAKEALREGVPTRPSSPAEMRNLHPAALHCHDTRLAARRPRGWQAGCWQAA